MNKLKSNILVAPSWINDTHREKLVLYWIQHKNSLKYKVWLLPTFFISSHNQLSCFNSIIVQMSEKSDSSNRQ